MKRIAILFWMMLWATPLWAQTTLDSMTVPTAVPTTGASVGGAFTGPTVTGVNACSGGVCDAIVVCTGAAVNGAAVVTDTGTCNGSHTVTQAQDKHQAGVPLGDINIAVCNNPSAGSHTFTSTDGAGTANQSMIAMRVTGTTSAPAIGGGTRNNGSSSTLTVPGLTATNSAALGIMCGYTAVSQASVGATTNATQQANILGSAPSLFAQTAFGASQLTRNYASNWTSMATATTSLAASVNIPAAQGLTGVVVDYVAEGDTSSLNGVSTVNALTPNSNNAQCTAAGTPYACCTGVGTGTCVECMRLTLCAASGVMVNPTCGVSGAGTCPCTRVMGPTTYNSGGGSKATFLCLDTPGSGCQTNGFITCQLGATITTGTTYSDDYQEPSNTCNTDGTPTSGSFVGVDATFAASPAASGQISGIHLGDMVLRDICDVANADFGTPGFSPGATGYLFLETGTLAERQTGDSGQINAYPVTAAGPATMPVENDVATQPGAVGVVILSAATATPTATATPSLACNSAILGGRTKGLRACGSSL